MQEFSAHSLTSELCNRLNFGGDAEVFSELLKIRADGEAGIHTHTAITQWLLQSQHAKCRHSVMLQTC